MIKNVGIFVLALMMTSCAVSTVNMSANGVLPRKGYVFIKKIVNLRKCVDNRPCENGQYTSVGSGFIVKITHKGSFVVTAAHVCATNPRNLQPKVEIRDTLKVQTLDGRYYDAKVLEYNRDLDVCLMYSDGLVDNIEEVNLSGDAPKEGDKVYNIASPYGIHYNNVVPIFEGRYFGTLGFRAFYSFDAAPGSSGSMILNQDGELIGLLHSVYRQMHSVIVSVDYDSLISFIRRGIIKYSTSHAKELYDYNIYVNKVGSLKYPKY